MNEDKPTIDANVEDNIVSTKHSLRLRGKEIKYTATVGTMVLKEEVDKQGHKPRAEMFFIAFTRDGVKSHRPLTFSFNGAPLKL
ncbi:MAG: hypothetical protein ACO2Y9_11835, partial [Pseudohongiellaceae bacterium]